MRVDGLACPALNLLAKYLPALLCKALQTGVIIPLRQIDCATVGQLGAETRDFHLTAPDFALTNAPSWT